MTPPARPRPTRSTGTKVGAVVLATAALTALASLGVAATAGPTSGGAPPVERWTPADAAAVAVAVRPVAVPTGPDGTPCGGSYLSTQVAGAAAPAVRATPSTGP